MKYRKFGKLEWHSSLLGFGAMRLPVIQGDPSRIDEEEATKMIYYAIDQGVNYIDTAYPYHKGKSEPFLGKILKGEYRKKVRIATKLPVWLVEKKDDCDRIFEEQLERLREKMVDFYLFHGLSKDTWKKTKEMDLLSWAERRLIKGEIGCLGFSFHDEFPLFKEIIDSYDGWGFCQIQYNYFDKEFQAGTKGLHYAYEKGLAVVIMEPLKGGSLAKAPPGVKDFWERAKEKRNPVEWGLLWVWNHPEVSVALSGMSILKQVKENIEIASRAKPGILSPNELDLIEEVRKIYQSLRPIPCTGCNYCKECPVEIPISEIFDLYNDGLSFDQMEKARKAYREWIEDEKKADKCLECGQCESLCPQGLPIRFWLKKVHQELSP